MTTKRETLTGAVMQAANGGNAVTQQPSTVKALLAQPNIQARFKEVLNERAPQFMASIINLTTSDRNLAEADPMSVLSSAMVAAALDLPVDKNLGYMWIVGRRDKHRGGIIVASPQMGYKGYIQLALRSGQYKSINVIEVCEGELVKWNRLTEECVLDFDSRKSDAVIGYAAYFELLNGFKKTVYWTKEQVTKHKERFSQTDKLWRTDWDAMAKKTVLKAMLSRWGILSIQMQKAIVEGDNDEQEQPKEIDENEINFYTEEPREVNQETGEIIDVEAKEGLV